MRFDPRQIREETSRDFEAAWMAGTKYAGERRLNEKYPRSVRSFSCAKPHPVFETIQKLREAYLRLGFEEVMNPVILEEAEVKRQFGKEALAVLDRCYYLAGLPRPDIGISEGRVKQMSAYFTKEFSDSEIEALRNTLHRYKKGEIDGDDLVYAVATSMDMTDIEVANVLDTVFPELKSLSPVPSRSTLRSHMTSGWFLTLAELWMKNLLPLKLFSVDRCFRREQREGEIRLRTYYSASCVLCSENVSVDDGKEIAAGLLSQFGFENIRFRKDEKRSKYYVPETQTEVFSYHPRIGWVEVATFGIYSPTALAQYDIPFPVVNLGLGVERLTMILHDAKDIRALAFPQFYAPWELSDMQIVGMVRVEGTPGTVEGEQIAQGIVRVCEAKGSEKSPCEFLAYRGTLFGRDIDVWMVEPEEHTLLCGPAYLNELVVHDGALLGIPRTDKWAKLFDVGVQAGIRFLDAFAALAACRIEESVRTGEIEEKDCAVKVKIVRSSADINITIDEVVMRYITSKKKKIDIRGPVFLTAVGKKAKEK